MTKHKKKRIRIKDPKRLLILLLIIIIIVIAIASKNNNIKKKENLSLIINNEDVISKLENDIVIKDEVVYLEYSDIKKCIDSNIYQEEEKIVTSSNKKVAAIELGKKEIEINGSAVQIKGQAFKTEEGKIYLPISELSNVYDVEFLYVPEYKNIVMDSYSNRLEKADLKKSQLIKEQANKSSANLEKLEKGSTVIYISEQNGWAKVRTQNGNIGYLKKNKLTNFVVVREEMQEKEQVSSNTSYYEKDITNNNIEKYNNRKKVIEDILEETVNKKQQVVKIIYKNKKDTESFKRFKLEATAFLKECGIGVIFE